MTRRDGSYLLFFLLLLLTACQSKSTETSNPSDSTKETASASEQEGSESEEKSPEVKEDASASVGLIYRSDGFRPGVASEWVQVDTDPEKNVIRGIWYWSTADENPIRLKIIKQEFSGGEISGYTADVSFPDSPEVIKLGIVEDKVNLTWSDEQFQEFTYQPGE
ncbi:MAG: hypothetical protein OHK0053_26700 [Microscillaceae bacterium]